MRRVNHMSRQNGKNMNSIYQIRITLKDTKPPIWRRVAVGSEITLGQLHDVIQIVMGWTDSHLHQFSLRNKALKPSPDEIARWVRENTMDERFLDSIGGQRFFVPKVTPWGEPTDMEGEDEAAIILGEVCPKVKNKIIYEYDFGDDWEHVVEVQKITEPEPGVEYPVCLAGKKACPSEDCGGVWGYSEMLEAITDSDNDQHEDMLEWVGDGFDPDAFDLEEVNMTLTDWRKDN